MKALLTSPPGGWSQTALVDLPDPIPAEHEVLVQIRAASLNPADRFLIEGIYPGGPKPPFITGRDAAGIVLHADSNNRFPVGTPVVALQSALTDLRRGPLCERQVFHVDSLSTFPSDWSFIEAAAAPLVFQTAWQALTNHGPVTSGTAVVVTGATGGVGLAACQLARGLGARVVALSRSASKQARMQALGFEHVASPDDPNVKKRVFEMLGRKGADVVVETVGGRMLNLGVHLLAHRGRLSALGVLDGVEGTIPIPSLMFKRAMINGVLVTDATAAEAQADWKAITQTLASSGQRPQIDAVFELENYLAAFDRLQSGPFGKVIVEARS